MQAEEILIGYFAKCQSIKKVGGRRSVEELYQALFFVSPSRRNVSPSETKIEPDRRLVNSLPVGAHHAGEVPFGLNSLHEG